MNCGQCGVEVPAASAFCPHCGAQLANSAADSPAKSAAARMAPAGTRGGNAPPEETLWSGSYSPKAMADWAAAAAALTIVGAVVAALTGPPGWIVFAIGALILWAAIGLVALYRRMTVRYQLTTFRLFHETGLLSRTRDRIEVIDIDDVTLRQGLIERMFNVGTIHVRSSDMTHGNLAMVGIEDARTVTDLIDNTRRAERQRRGLFMENV
jgi:membrane protein YdbS with pleckstrin-like domain